MSRRPWHKRFHGDAITGYMGLSLEERGAYSTLLDYLYDRGEPLVGNIRLIAGYLDVSVRKAQSVVDSLVEKGKLTRLPDGRITNNRFEKERENDAKTTDHMAEIGSSGGNKSAERRKKSNKNNGRKKATLETRSSYPDTRYQIPESKNLNNPETPLLLPPPQAAAEATGKRKSAIPDGFPHDAAKRAAADYWLKQGRPDLAVAVDDQAAQFRDHFIGHGKKMVDWAATWRTWIRNAPAMTRPPAGQPRAVAANSGQGAAPTPEQWARRLEAFFHGDEEWIVAPGHWRTEWGPRPGQPGCQAPPDAARLYRTRHIKAGAGGP